MYRFALLWRSQTRNAFLLMVAMLAAACPESFAQQNSASVPTVAAHQSCVSDTTDTAFVPVDSWIYPAVLRLYSMGYLHSVYISERPWTRASIGKMLDEVGEALNEAQYYENSTNDEAQNIYASLLQVTWLSKFGQGFKCKIGSQRVI